MAMAEVVGSPSGAANKPLPPLCCCEAEAQAEAEAWDGRRNVLPPSGVPSCLRGWRNPGHAGDHSNSRQPMST